MSTFEILRDILSNLGTPYSRAGGLLNSLFSVSIDEDEYTDIYDLDCNGSCCSELNHEVMVISAGEASADEYESVRPVTSNVGISKPSSPLWGLCDLECNEVLPADQVTGTLR